MPTPPRPRTSTICSVAYATELSGSEQNTGSARRLGSSVSPRRSLRSGRLTKSRFGVWNTSELLSGAPSVRRPTEAGPDLDAVGPDLEEIRTLALGTSDGVDGRP